MSSLTPAESAAAAVLIDPALAEDLGDLPDDVTSRLLVPADRTGAVNVVAREPGVLAGLPVAELVCGRFGGITRFEPHKQDGDRLEPGTRVATLHGTVRDLLTAERTVLNFLTHLSGVASLTREFVDAVAGTNAAILDTRKTLPGYRLLAKYAVRCGGGTNHRMGLHDACLVKDNHLAAWRTDHPGDSLTDLIRGVKSQLEPGVRLIVEVDRLDQCAAVLPAAPDVVLLDNMPPDTLREAVAMRDAVACRDERGPGVLLEASGGVNLSTVRAIAQSGVDRISVGALTHSAPTLDLGFDWPDR